MMNLRLIESSKNVISRSVKKLQRDLMIRLSDGGGKDHFGFNMN